MDKDDLWMVEHCSELVTTYAGKYVAVVHETLVVVGDAGQEVEDQARAMASDKMPSVLRVPREEALEETVAMATRAEQLEQLLNLL
jgi:hypothetical protein